MNNQFNPVPTDNNNLEEPQRSNTSYRKYFIIGGAIFGIIIIGIVVYFLLNTNSATPIQPENGQSQPEPSGQEKNVKNQEKFLLLLGGKSTRSDGAYQLNPTFTAQILDSQRKHFAEQLDKAPQEESIYQIDFIKGDGKRKTIYSSVSYCPPSTDVCETLTDREPPSNSQSHWSSTPVIIEPELEKIEFSVAGKVIKTITKPKSPPKVNTLNKISLSEGTEITWDIAIGDAEYVGLALEYLSSPNNWQTAGSGDVETFTAFTADSNSIQSTLEIIDFRLVATDGFHIDSYLAEDYISTPIVKELEIFLSGEPTNERTVGQDMFLDLSFFDPQTGVGCGGDGCQSGANQGKYNIVWTSDRQNICQSDITKNGLEYRFKKTGTHTVTVKVRHTEKEYLRGEASVKVNVSPSPFPVEDNTDPNCS
jgi:hypothetical protein